MLLLVLVLLEGVVGARAGLSAVLPGRVVGVVIHLLLVMLLLLVKYWCHPLSYAFRRLLPLPQVLLLLPLLLLGLCLLVRVEGPEVRQRISQRGTANERPVLWFVRRSSRRRLECEFASTSEV